MESIIKVLEERHAVIVWFIQYHSIATDDLVYKKLGETEKHLG